MASKFVVLTYHRVTEEPDLLRPGMCHASDFRKQVALLRRFFTVLTLGDAVARLDAGTLPSRCVAITFDDGYRDNHDVALPILQAAGLCATFFVANGYLDGGVMWNDYVFEAVRARPKGEWDLHDAGLGLVEVDGIDTRIALAGKLIRALKYLPQETRGALAKELGADGVAELSAPLMMTQAQVAALASSGMEIGAHTVNHPILNEVTDSLAREEMTNNRDALSSISDQEVSLFAYPNGKPGRDFSERHATLAKEVGFAAAFTTQWGYVCPANPRFEMPRIGLEDELGFRYVAKLGKAFWQAAK